MENLGILAALVAALAWGSYIVPFKISRSSNLIQFQALMTVGVFLFALIISPILGYSINFNVYGLLSGVMWASANAISLIVVSDLGMSKGLPIWVSLVILTSFLWGALAFNELPAGILIGLIGIIIIILGVALVSSTGNVESRNVKRGLMTAVVAGIIFGSQFVPLKLGQLSPQVFFFPMSLGIMLTGLFIALILRVKLTNEAVLASLLSGAIWNIGNLLAVIAISLIGLSKGFPVTQSAVLIAVLWGLFYFKEITGRRNKLQVLLGAVILLIGVIVLGLA